MTDILTKLFPPNFVGVVTLLTVAAIGFTIPFFVIASLTESVKLATIAGGIGEVWVLAVVLND